MGTSDFEQLGLPERTPGDLAADDPRALQRHQDLVESASAVHWEMMLPDGAFTFVGRPAKSVLGYPPDRWVSDPGFWPSILHTDDLALWRDAVAEAEGSGRPIDLDCRAIRPDGRVIWLQVLARRARDRNGRPVLRGILVDIDVRKTRELGHQALLRQLNTANALLDAVLRQLPTGVVVLEAPGGRMILRNAVADAIAGEPMDAARVSDYRADRRFHSDGRPYTPDELPGVRALARGETVVNEEIGLERPDGTRIITQMSAAPVRDVDGQIVAAVVMIHDITTAKRAEEDLRASERRSRLLADSVPDQVWTATPDGRLDYVNGRTLEYFGRTAEQMIGEGWQDVVHPDDLPEVVEQWTRSLATGEPYAVEFRLRRADGEYRCHIGRALPERDADGRVVRWFGTNTDIEEQRRVEAELRAREEQFRALAESIPQLAWMADRDGWIFWYNQRWYDYTGTTLAEMQGWGWKQVHHPDHVARVTERIRYSWETGTPWEDVFPLRSRDGAYRWFLSRAMPIRDAHGDIVRWFGTNTDITELHEAEAIRDRALGEARRANQAKSEFLAAMAHDLRTPLNAIGGYADLVEDGVFGPTTDGQRSAMTRIRGAQRHLLSLIDAILGFATIEAGAIRLDIVEFTAHEVIAAARPMVELQAAEKGLSLVWPVAADSMRVRADRERTVQILVNLLTNAVKFTDAGSIAVECTAEGGVVRIAVLDTGRGIPADRLAAIFEPFVQVPDAGGAHPSGFGLGLATSRELARAMAGDLSVASVPGRGSVFTLTLPRGSG